MICEEQQWQQEVRSDNFSVICSRPGCEGDCIRFHDFDFSERDVLADMVRRRQAGLTPPAVNPAARLRDPGRTDLGVMTQRRQDAAARHQERERREAEEALAELARERQRQQEFEQLHAEREQQHAELEQQAEQRHAELEQRRAELEQQARWALGHHAICKTTPIWK